MPDLGPAPSHPGLGAIVREVELGQRGGWLALQAVVIFAGLIVVAGVLGAAHRGDADHRLSTATELPLVAVGLALILGGILIVPRVSRRSDGAALVIHQHGFIRQHGAGRIAVRWDEVLGLRVQRERIETSYNLRTVYPWTTWITTAIGTLELGVEQGGPALAEIVDEQARPQVWKRMLTAFDAGGGFWFGSVLASPHGLQIGNEKLAWEHVQLVEDAGHQLRIHTDFGGTVVDRVGVSFSSVLAELAEQVWARQGDVAKLARTLTAPELAVGAVARVSEARLRD